MLIHTIRVHLQCQRGVALPVAMLSLLILSALIVAFSMMAASEPILANNQLQVAQARAIAESGVERAIWALNEGLSNPSNPQALPNPLVTAGAPYDGSTTVPVNINGTQAGVFSVTVSAGATSYERNIVATGWAPTNTGSGPKSKQKIQVTVARVRFLDPPAALTVRGEINAGGHSLIDSRADTSCGNKVGTYSKGATTVGGSAVIYGAPDGNNIANQSTDMTQNAADATFDPYTYGPTELNALKALAKANGTYYQGTVLFNASNRMPNGIIFVDTVTGCNIDTVCGSNPNPTPTSDFGSLTIHGNPALDPSGIFSGVIVVAGSLSISGNFQMHGLVYVQNDFTYMGTGTGQIVGAVMSQNIRDTSATSIDTDTGGNSTIVWNCGYAKNGGGLLPPTFTIEPGTYKEISG